MKRVFILNPRAGAGVLRRRMAELESYFRHHTGRFHARLCESRDETTQQTRAALREGADQVVAVGGDGTMNAVANGFFADGRPVRPDACLAVARIGTGSDYFRTLSGSRPVDWREIVLNPQLRAADVGVIRRLEEDRPRPIYFLNLATFGLSAEIVAGKEKLPRWLPRSLCYLLPTLAGYLTARPWSMQIELDGQPLLREATTFMVGKGVYAGGGMRFGGRVALDDGQFEVTVFGPMSILAMLRKTPKLYRGDFEGETKIEKLIATRVVVRAERPLPAECDGELIGAGASELSLLPRAIQVCVPSDEA